MPRKARKAKKKVATATAAPASPPPPEDDESDGPPGLESDSDGMPDLTSDSGEGEEDSDEEPPPLSNVSDSDSDTEAVAPKVAAAVKKKVAEVDEDAAKFVLDAKAQKDMSTFKPLAEAWESIDGFIPVPPIFVQFYEGQPAAMKRALGCKSTIPGLPVGFPEFCYAVLMGIFSLDHAELPPGFEGFCRFSYKLQDAAAFAKLKSAKAVAAEKAAKAAAKEAAKAAAGGTEKAAKGAAKKGSGGKTAKPTKSDGQAASGDKKMPAAPPARPAKSKWSTNKLREALNALSSGDDSDSSDSSDDSSSDSEPDADEAAGVPAAAAAAAAGRGEGAGGGAGAAEDFTTELDKLKADLNAARNKGSLKEAYQAGYQIAQLAVDQVETRDKRIAELTAEVERLTGSKGK